MVSIRLKFLENTLRPVHVKHRRLFLQYRFGKCTIQPVGINQFSKIPTLIARYLQLLNPECYTGHSFRRTSATFLVGAGADILSLKRHGGWRSSSVAEGYLEDCMEGKIQVSNQILVGKKVYGTNSAASTSATENANADENCLSFTSNHSKPNGSWITDVHNSIASKNENMPSASDIPKIYINNVQNSTINIVLSK